jgi:hypothetical protein
MRWDRGDQLPEGHQGERASAPSVKVHRGRRLTSRWARGMRWFGNRLAGGYIASVSDDIADPYALPGGPVAHSTVTLPSRFVVTEIPPEPPTPWPGEGTASMPTPSEHRNRSPSTTLPAEKDRVVPSRTIHVLGERRSGCAPAIRNHTPSPTTSKPTVLATMTDVRRDICEHYDVGGSLSGSSSLSVRREPVAGYQAHGVRSRRWIWRCPSYGLHAPRPNATRMVRQG